MFVCPDPLSREFRFFNAWNFLRPVAYPPKKGAEAKYTRLGFIVFIGDEVIIQVLLDEHLGNLDETTLNKTCALRVSRPTNSTCPLNDVVKTSDHRLMKSIRECLHDELLTRQTNVVTEDQLGMPS